MRIAHYSTSLSRSAGGLYASVSGLARAQRELGADVVVFGGADEHFAEDAVIWGNVPLVSVPLGHRYGFDLGLASALRNYRADILHLHGIWSASSLYGLLSTARAVVVSPRGMLDPWILARRPLVKGLHAAIIERPLLRRAHVHALNEAERKSVLAFAPSLGDRVFELPNGIDAVTDQHVPTERRGALYLGRVHEKKQVLELVEAWSRLETDAGLTIAGWGEPQYQAEVASLCAEAHNVKFVGPLYGEDKSAAFRSARFFVLPSFSEGMPMAALEAIQNGCIPVLTDQCNLPELFRHGIAERVEGDFSDFSEVMQRLLALSDAEYAWRSTGAIAFSENYLWAEIAGKMLERYADILAGTAR